MAPIAASVAASETTISSLTLGSRSISYDSSPRPVPTMPFCTPRPVMRVMFRPQMPLAESASLTEFSFSGRIIASIFCIVTMPPISPASPESQLTSGRHLSHGANVTGLLSLQRRRHALLRRREVCRPRREGGPAADLLPALMLHCPEEWGGLGRPRATIQPDSMTEKILVCVAWPYANGSLHTGQIVGAYLPADIFARYQRALGNRVIMVSGSDQHGTPVTVRAEAEGVPPGRLADRFHQEFLDSWQRLGITFDLFTSTGTENHARVTQDIFLRLLERDHIYPAFMSLPYCANDDRFLPDRYVEGTCPACGHELARGDQCDNCGRTLNAPDLLSPRCKICGATPEWRDEEHFFLRLSAFNDRLKEWVSAQKHWRKAVVNWTLGILTEGLQDRAITRNIDWGIPIPVEGWESKRIYVWFEAVIGYLSASREWAERSGDPEAWREFWLDPAARSYYFVGKDNIPFHTIIWPAMLMGYSEGEEKYNLPYDVPANQYQTVRGSKASTSQRLAIWVPDYLSRYDPDPLRYYLSVNMLETSDADFSWADFVRRNNDELVATWGNLVNRVLTFAHRNFEGAVPAPGAVTAADSALLAKAEGALAATGENIGLCRFRAGLESAMVVAREANRYVEENAPWALVKEDRERCATVLHTAIGVIAALNTALYPYLPFTCQQLHGYLGNEGPVEAAGWRSAIPQPGRPLAEPKPLFRKLDPSIVEEEEARLGQ